jgi:hypothetical protein
LQWKLVPDCGAIQKNAERCKNLTEFQKRGRLWLETSWGMTLFLRVNESWEILIRLSRE